jgi:ribosomal-protein-alanine N-acetyltransferase
MSNNAPNYSIRFARPEDVPNIIDLMRPYNMHHIPSPEMNTLDYKCFVVAEQKEKLIGAAGYTFLSYDVGKTTLLAVHPDFRNNGLGTVLQIKRMQILRDFGCVKVITNADRPETIAWYKKYFGYREIGKLPKMHSFGLVDVSEWTTLEADLTTADVSHPAQHKCLISTESIVNNRKNENTDSRVTHAQIERRAVKTGEPVQAKVVRSDKV